MWGVDVLRSLGPDSVPRIQEARISDALVLGFTAALCVLQRACCSGWFRPGRRRKPDLNSGSKTTAGRAPLRHIKTAFAAVLVVGAGGAARWCCSAGAGLLIKSFWTLQSLSPGSDATKVLTAGVWLSFNDYPNGAPRAKSSFSKRLSASAKYGGSRTGRRDLAPTFRRSRAPNAFQNSSGEDACTSRGTKLWPITAW